jgi:hypothetical protein
MSPKIPDRRRAARRAAFTGLAGLVGVSAVVAVPVLTSDGTSEAQVVSDAPVEESTTTTTTPSPEVQALAAFASVTPEQQNFIIWSSLPQEQRDFITFASATEEQRNFIVWTSSTNEARAAFANALTPQPAPSDPPAAPSQSRATVSAEGSVWDSLAQCEAGGDWAANTGNGYSGGLQFAASTWRAYGGGEFAPMAWQASREQQIEIAERVLASSGWGAWPACSRRLGLR